MPIDVKSVNCDNERLEANCSDVTQLAKELEEQEKLSAENLEKLYTLKICLRHEVPPQHQIETCAGSHAPKQKEIEQFKQIIPIKKGSYSPEEDKIIVKNWKAFCKTHGWKIKLVAPFLFLRNGNSMYIRSKMERRKFVQFLADGLPNRTLYSVYHRFRNLYDSHLQRRYEKEEDQMIIDHIENNPNVNSKCMFAVLAKILNRTRASVWRRYQLLKRKRKLNVS